MTTRTLKLISSMATRELLATLAAQYANETGQPVETESAGGVEVAKRVGAGEPADVVVLAANAIAKLAAEGRVLPDSQAALVKSGVAIAVRAGTLPLPDVTTEADVKAAVLAAPSLSYSTGPSGVYLEQLFERWGILAQLRPRIVVPPPGVPVGSLVADGRAALGFQQLSELMNLPGVQVLGPLPDAIQTLTVFSGAVCTASEFPQAASALLAFLNSPVAAPVKRRHGMQSAN